MTRAAGILWCAGCLGAFFSPENVYIVLCKLVKGLGVGIASVSVPLYIFDVLVTPHRSLAIGWATAFGVLGEAIMYALGVLLRTTLRSGAIAFHFCWVAEIFWGVLLLVTSFFLPESPKFLARSGDWARATASLERFSRQRNISLTSVPLHASKFADLFSKQVRKRFFFAVTVQLFARTCCILGITHVSHYTLTFCRLETSVMETLYGVFFALQFFFSCLSIWIMKSSRRKDMLAYGFFLLTIAFTSLGATSYVYSERSNLFILYAPVEQVSFVSSSTVLALTGFAFSVTSLLISSLAMLFTLELLPSRSRSKGVSIAISTAWTVDTLASTLCVGLSSVHPSVFFLILASVSFFGMFMVVFVYEENNPVEGLPFPLRQLSKSAEAEDEKARDLESDELAGIPGIDGQNSDRSSAAGSVRKKPIRGQNFVPMHDDLGKQAKKVPEFVVTEPIRLSTSKSELEDSQMKTAGTRFSLRRDGTNGPVAANDDRLVAIAEGDRLIPIDSKMTVTGLWSDVSDPDV